MQNGQKFQFSYDSIYVFVKVQEELMSVAQKQRKCLLKGVVSKSLFVFTTERLYPQVHLTLMDSQITYQGKKET